MVVAVNLPAACWARASCHPHLALSSGAHQGDGNGSRSLGLAPRLTPGSESRYRLLGAHLTIERDADDSSPEPSTQQANSPLPPSTDPVTAEHVSFYTHSCT